MKARINGLDKTLTHTVMTHDDGYNRMIYHRTTVAKHNSSEIVLNHGGYMTATTKMRMNQYASINGLDFQVWQDDFDWFVSWQGETLPFTDNTLTLNR